MAYCAADLIGNIENIIGPQNLDYILISHSHYDHIGAVPYLREKWPDLKVFGAKYAKRVLDNPKAQQIIWRLGREAAKIYSFGGSMPEYDKALLRVDDVVADGDIIDLGGIRIAVIETQGHTQCSLSFLVNDEVMFASESAGYMNSAGKIVPAYISSYSEAIASIQKCLAINPRRIISPHYGPVKEEDTPGYWRNCLAAAQATYDFIVALAKKGYDQQQILNEYEQRFHDEESRREQPISAFRMNAQSTIRKVLEESSRSG